MAPSTPIVEDVAARGYPAAREATAALRRRRRARAAGAGTAAGRRSASLDPAVRDALAESIRRARIVHEAQRREDVDVAGRARRHRHRALDPGRAGRPVRARRAGRYPSSVVMNVVPAQVAGVESIAVFSPPQREFGGRPHPTILAACALLGVDEVYAVGGAQAIALAAYGDAGLGIEPVDVITGPGNVYVAAAKRLVRGVVGIDAEAGPTEIAVLADADRRPGARRRRPDQPGRARHARGVRPGHRLGRTGRRGRRRGRAAGRAHQARRAGPRRAVRAAVGHGPRPRSRAGPGGGRRLRRRAPRGHHRRRAAVGRAGPQRRLHLRRPALPGVARRLLRRVEPRAAHRVHRAARVGAVGAVVPQGRAPGRVHARRAGRGAPHVLALAEAEDLPAHGAAVAARLP